MHASGTVSWSADSTGDEGRVPGGEGLGVRNMPFGTGTLRSTATSRGEPGDMET